MTPVNRAAPSPCVKLCRLDAAGAVCLGCGRTIDEIVGWSAFDEAARHAVLARLARRPARRDAD